MNKIYWDKDKITIITDQLEAIEHKHWTLQLFFGMEKDLDVYVSEKKLTSKCVLVNQNIVHRFSAANYLHISMIFEPTSVVAKHLSNIIKGKDYHIFSGEQECEIERLGYKLLHDDNVEDYNTFVQILYDYLGIPVKERIYDHRIKELMHHIDHCDCNEHSIAYFSEKVSLSPSRLSHLFKEQVGIPLKSYIQLHQLQKAFNEMLNGRSVTEAAMRASFDSPSHFAAVTKKVMGTPASISLKNSVFLKVFDS